MSGEGSDPSASENVRPAPRPQTPIAPAAGSGRELRARIWLGLPLAVVGGYLLGDTSARFRLAWDAFTAWWPWILLGLAAFNLVRSVLRIETLLAPGLLSFAALLALGLRNGVAAPLMDVVVPIIVVLAGAALVLSAGSRLGRSWTRILMTGRVVASESAAGVLRPRAILGELKVDLSPLTESPGEVQVTVVFGHVRLVVPAGWRLNLRASGALLTPVRGVIGTGPSEVQLRVLGFCGAVSVVRAAPAIPEPAERRQV
ncbi:hypothetical protein [Amycolatopsis sp. NPDC049868]|uniref:hypothetical protein n=1 Tax=Amycolatopsis sp. NPDC049868 TaxID=3363934 RepID=UPI0037A05089